MQQMKKRTIDPSFFLNDKLAECTLAARLWFIGLWCAANPDGLLEYRPKRLKVMIFPHENHSPDDLTNELAREGFIRIYMIGGTIYIEIVKFRKHQNIHWNEKGEQIPAPQEYIESIPSKNEARASQVNISKSISNNNNIIIAKPVPKNPEPPYEIIIGHLNRLSGKHYKATSRSAQKNIKARWRDGYTLEDFFYVHEVKWMQWAGTEYEMYMRPETLYGNKFDGYLNTPKPDATRNLPERTRKNLLVAAEYLTERGHDGSEAGSTPGTDADSTGRNLPVRTD